MSAGLPITFPIADASRTRFSIRTIAGNLAAYAGAGHAGSPGVSQTKGVSR
jgi:hypothetical protein